jgi:AcrR family transcriptional regulator
MAEGVTVSDKVAERSAQSAEPSQPTIEPAGEPGNEPQSTRERILDVALELFVEQGIDKTSLREIAERMGFSKAALYYHFASKDDMVMALHMRLHGLMSTAVAGLDATTADPASWAPLLNRMIDEIAANRMIFMLHERNRSALERLHSDDGHEAQHEDLEARMREFLADESIPLRDRVRISAAFGAVLMGGMLSMSGSALNDQSVEPYLREIVADLLT